MVSLSLSVLLALLLLASAIGHVVAPAFYAGFIPEPVPPALANSFAAIVEGAIGVALFIPRFRGFAGLAFAVLMIGFLPLHVWDALKEAPAIGTHAAAVVRIVVQIFFIAAGLGIFWAERQV